MNVKSMTGYGKATLSTDICDVKVEMKSVNNRYFDAFVRMPKILNFMEINIKSLLREKLVRGKVDVYIELTMKKVQYVPKLNEEVADKYYELLNTLKDKYSLSNGINLEHMLRFNDVISSEEDENMGEELTKPVMETVERCIQEIDSMRLAEGRNMADDLKERLGILKSITDNVDENRDGVYEYWFNKFKKRMEDMGVGSELEERIVQEASVMSEKADVTEEVTRLYSHIDQFANIIDNEESCGKKLDFLCQEFQREFNTIGSKTGNVGIINKVVQGKSEVDKIREQVQNIV